jgi:hypothetical protein
MKEMIVEKFNFNGFKFNNKYKFIIMGNIHINHFAVIVSALSTFLLGGLWYSPILLGKAWQRENKFSDEDLKNTNMVKIFGLSFIFSLVMAYNLAFFLGDPSIRAGMGALYGLFTGLGWVAMSICIIGLFERKTWTYLLINAGYVTIAFTLMGLIIGVWK